MEKENLKRGVELGNRFGEGGFSPKINKAFSWWTGGEINRKTISFLVLVFILHLYFTFPLLTRDLTVSFSSSASFMFLGNTFESLGIPKSFFFGYVSFIALVFAPISFYLFARRIALRHEITALFATLLFILPNPFWRGGLPLAQAILSGDGAHAFAFSFIPILLLFIETFIKTGQRFWGSVSSIGAALIAFISPFAFFNLSILILITTIAEGFMGNFRIKISRLIFLFIASIALSLFWYYPTVSLEILDLSHVSFAINKFWSIFPILIPLIPIAGIVFFLILDRREKLKPIFISFAFLALYISLYSTSKNLAVSGIFTADRYLIELSFARSLFSSIVIVLIAEFVIRNYVLSIKNKFIMFFLCSVSFGVIIALGFISLRDAHTTASGLTSSAIINPYNLGIGSIKRSNLNFFDLIAAGMSVVTFVFLMIMLLKNIEIVDIIKDKKD